MEDNREATKWKELPDDLVGAILLKLPIQPMIRFKAVSKDWLRLINSKSTSFFVLRQHLEFVFRDLKPILIPLSVLPGGCGDGDGDGITVRPPQVDLHQLLAETTGKFSLFPAGCGIFCVTTSRPGTVVLWNPTNNQTKRLPPSPYYPSERLCYLFPFATVVEGKDGTFSYKVGRVIFEVIEYQPLQLSLSLELYSSKTKSWKFIPKIFTGRLSGYRGHSRHCANLNGKAHWVILSPEDDMQVTAFDYETEVFTRINAPRGYDKRRCLVTLFDEKFLCLALYTPVTDPDRTLYLDIWVLRRYGDEDSWVKEFTVGPLFNYIEVLGFSSKAQVLFIQDPYSPGYLLFCDCKSSNIVKYLQIGKGRNRHMQVVENVGSLVSLPNQ